MASKKHSKEPPEKIALLALIRDDQKYLYYVDRVGSVVRMQRGVAKAKTDVVVAKAVVRERGFDYFVDGDGDVAREPA
jgi:hypothetical protein